jgi:hypothetical protein
VPALLGCTPDFFAAPGFMRPSPTAPLATLPALGPTRSCPQLTPASPSAESLQESALQKRSPIEAHTARQHVQAGRQCSIDYFRAVTLTPIVTSASLSFVFPLLMLTLCCFFSDPNYMLILSIMNQCKCCTDADTVLMLYWS